MSPSIPPSGRIDLTAIRVSANIGVPGEERAVSQTLEVDVCLIPNANLEKLGDDITRTIDYHAVWLHIRKRSAERPRKLIETLAEELAGGLLADFPLAAVEVTVRKFVLPDTGSVSVSLARQRGKS